jgi:hypothetical protein
VEGVVRLVMKHETVGRRHRCHDPRLFPATFYDHNQVGPRNRRTLAGIQATSTGGFDIALCAMVVPVMEPDGETSDRLAAIARTLD